MTILRESETNRRCGAYLVWTLPLLAAGLAFFSLRGDSITFDETAHFASGLSHLETGDFRMLPVTPPLARMVLAWPGLWGDYQRPDVDAPGWRNGDSWVFGRYLLYDINDGPTWIMASRCASVMLFVLLCLLVRYAATSVFDSRAGCVSLLFACLSPSLLAHGRLVTTDVPITLALLAVIVTFSRIASGVSLTRVLLFTGALSVASLTKFSWPIVIPALLVVTIMVVVKPAPIAVRFPWKKAEVLASTRGRKFLALSLVMAITAIGVYASIWACYGFRYTPFRGPDAASASMLGLSAGGKEAATGTEPSWKMTLEHASGEPLPGATNAFVRWAREHRLLPEAYLFGLAYTRKTVVGQPAYLLGEVYDGGKWWYFPIAFLVKTPASVLLMIVVSVVLLLTRAGPPVRDQQLAAGLLVFALAYVATAVSSDMNLGERHLLPAYPAMFVLLGISVSLWRWLAGRIFHAIVILVFVIESASAFPSYLGYFNWMAGGSSQGHKYLLDSNIDWGQDLIRLRDYVNSHRFESPIKLAYSGSADPSHYGLSCEVLPSHMGFEGSEAELGAGTYVVSLNQLYGLYTRQVRDEFWSDPRNQKAYRELSSRFEGAVAASRESEKMDDARAKDRYRLARQWRLINRLKHRAPDERAGSSMFVFHLTEDDVRTMLAPD